MSVVIGYVPNLMDRSKVSAAVPDAIFVGSPESLLPQVKQVEELGTVLVLVDLDRPGVIEAIGELVGEDREIIGFGSHVARDTLIAAETAGCQAFPRSELFRRLPELIAGKAPRSP